MSTNIRIAVYANSDDAFVAWAPSDFIPRCRGFLLERARPTKTGEKVEAVENRVGFARDKPKSGDHRPSDVWPFQRFNWTDHAVDVGARVRYRVTAMLAPETPGKPFEKGVASEWSEWATLSPDQGGGLSCYFNRGLVLSQFVAHYLKRNKLTPAAFKKQLGKSVDPTFRRFLHGDLGLRMIELLRKRPGSAPDLHAALYELGDDALEALMIACGARLNLILANGSDKTGDGNEAARQHLNDSGIPTIDRMLKSKGLGHNKFVVASDESGPAAVWTGSTNWSTTGLCTQVNNGLFIESRDVAAHFRAQWDRLRDASPPALDPAGFPKPLVEANDQPRTFALDGAEVTVWFTRTSDGRDMEALAEIIRSAKHAVLFLMFTPGKTGLHTLAAERAKEQSVYVRGVVSTLGNAAGDTDRNVLDIKIVSSHQTFKPDRYTVLQPQGVEVDLGPWIAEVSRRDFLSQVGHAIVHSKVLVVDPLSESPTIVTGSHNFSTSASTKNDENLVIVRGHRQLAAAYATHVMSVYQHYRFRSYVRETLARGEKPWSYLDDDDAWLREELKSKAQEIGFWA